MYFHLALLIPTLLVAGSPLPKRDASICSTGGVLGCILSLSDECDSGDNFQGGFVDINEGNCRQALNNALGLSVETKRGLIPGLGGVLGGLTGVLGGGGELTSGEGFGLGGLEGLTGGAESTDLPEGSGAEVPEVTRRELVGGLGGLTGALGGLTGGGKGLTGGLTGGQASSGLAGELEGLIGGPVEVDLEGLTEGSGVPELGDLAGL